ncbi:hypothetical protein GCM10023235_78660 [Kitasatospora terrestris]|uniref:Uncharacterized protein n=1 Tax=Kitasatospora terrestris TaxID=258051 RepID=A0ABP9DAV6_9ACTN
MGTSVQRAAPRSRLPSGHHRRGSKRCCGIAPGPCFRWWAGSRAVRSKACKYAAERMRRPWDAVAAALPFANRDLQGSVCRRPGPVMAPPERSYPFGGGLVE